MSFGHFASEDDAPFLMRDAHGWVIGENGRRYPDSSWDWFDGPDPEDLGPCDPIDDLDTVTVRLRCLDCGETAVFESIRGEVREDCPRCRSLNTEAVVEGDTPAGWGCDPFAIDPDEDAIFAEELARQARELGWPRRDHAA